MAGDEDVDVDLMIEDGRNEWGEDVKAAVGLRSGRREGC